MYYLKLVSFFFLLNIQNSFGAGSKDGSILDLKWPAINLIILLTVVIWKFRKSVSEMFTEKANQIREFYLRAEEKDKEAQIKFDMYKEKINTIDSHKAKILLEADEKIEKFKQDHSRTVKENILRLKKEVSDRFEFDKKQMNESLNTVLIEEVISKAKFKVSSDRESQNKASDQMLSGLN